MRGSAVHESVDNDGVADGNSHSVLGVLQDEGISVIKNWRWIGLSPKKIVESFSTED